MKVSIITVCLNTAETIEGTIRNVLAQDYKDIEYTIIDGGSSDGTLNIIDSYRTNISNIISEPDNGIYDAINKGIRLSKGDLIAILNSDDMYADEGVVQEMVEFIETHDLDAAYGDLVYVDHKDVTRVTRVWRAGEYKKGAFGKGWVPPHPTFFCRKTVYERYGYFKDEFQVAADFELMLRFIEKHRINVGYLPKVIVKMRTGGKANVLRGMIRGNREIMKSFRLNNLRRSPWLFIYKPMIKISQFLQRPSS